ncbi:Holliday junction DNA helicase RuvB [Geomicrobium sp. JCM 19039]|nr:Holliday junction DNA helicase RuvB [Geomicrobium sp. JCM 19039]
MKRRKRSKKCMSYLLQIGFLQRTPRGRLLTPLAYEHFGWPSQGEV